MDPKQLVLTWQRPMYNLAYRMLGNEADAADATQEIFVQVFKNLHRYDSRREFKPWIYQVGVHSIYNFLRDKKLRQEKENRAAMKEEPSSENFLPEEKELQLLLQREIAKLPEDSRSAIVLHYYQGLSQTEAADSLSIPRTTFQSQLDKALQNVKKGLAGSGYLVAVPQIEHLMQTSSSLSVPSSLSTSLIATAVQASASAAAATGITIGGMIVTKQILVGAVLIGIASLGIGLWAGGTFLKGNTPSNKQTTTDTASAENEKLRQENERLAARVKSLETEHQALRDASASREKMALNNGSPEINSAEKSPNSLATPTTTDGKIDWEKFSQLFAANLDLFLKMEGRSDEEREEPTEEEKGKLMELMTEFMKVARQAKNISETPLFDSKIFPELMQAILGKSLKLSPDQLRQLTSSSEAALSQATANFNASSALPIESWAKRQDLIDRFSASLPNFLNGDQKALWEKLNPAMDPIWQGDQSVIEFGLGDKKSKADKQVLQEWGRSYGLDSNQKLLAQDLAKNFVQECEKLTQSMTPENATRIKQEILALQIQKERELFNLLTPAQKEAARKKSPVIMRFYPGEGQNNSIRRGGMGF